VDESDRDGQRGRGKLLAKLGLEDKISLLTGADYWSLHGHPGIGLRPIHTSDGVLVAASVITDRAAVAASAAPRLLMVRFMILSLSARCSRW
jgi:hypothetical protein